MRLLACSPSASDRRAVWGLMRPHGGGFGCVVPGSSSPRLAAELAQSDTTEANLLIGHSPQRVGPGTFAPGEFRSAKREDCLSPE